MPHGCRRSIYAHCSGLAVFLAALAVSSPVEAQLCDTASCPAVKVYGDSEAAICRAWATEAVGQQLENEQRSCGQDSDDWHFDIKRHYRICLGLSQLDREQFAEGRRRSLRECRVTPKTTPKTPDKKTDTEPKAQESGKAPEWDEYCRKSYMVDALKVARSARDWNCTHVDNELHLSKQRHYDFCVKEAPGGAGDYPLHDMIGDRQEKIQKCQQSAAVKKPIDRKIMMRRRACSKFADIFLNATLENKRLDCKFSGDDWHDNWNAHYRSCTGLERSKRLRLIHNRQAKMSACRAKIFPKGQLEADDPDVKPDQPGKTSEAVRKACDAYAKDAVAHAAANQQLGCGFEGPLWNLSESKHVNACISERADFAFRSHLARDAKLRQCTSVRLCKDPTRAKTLFCQDLTGLVPPKAQSEKATKPKPAKSEAPPVAATGACAELKKGIDAWGSQIESNSENASFLSKHQKGMSWHGQNAKSGRDLADKGDQTACQKKLDEMPPVP